MKSKNRMLVVLMAILMLILNTSMIYAVDGEDYLEITEPGQSFYIPVTLTVEVEPFSVCVPSVLPVSVTDDGNVIIGDAMKIINNNSFPVYVSDIKIEGVNGWETTDYDTFIPEQTAFNQKLFAMKVGPVKTIGPDNQTSAIDPVVCHTELCFDYDIKISPQKENLTESVASVSLIVSWDMAEE